MTDSNSSIMSVGEMIDSAFGEADVNIVNHKLLQAILYLLARQLRLLERRVEVNIGPALRLTPSSSISVTEVKVHAMMKKKKQMGKSQTQGKEMVSTSVAGKGPLRKTAFTTDPPGIGVTALGTTSDKSKEQSISTKLNTEKSTSNKTSTEKSTSEKDSSSKSTSDKTSTDKTSSDKSSTEKSSSDKTSTEKTSTDKTSIEKSSSDKTSTEKSSSDKSSTEKSSSDKPSTDRTSTNKSSTDKSESEKRSTEVHKKTGKTSKDYQKLLETIEEQREKELRIIHQRGNSREEHGSSPTPMTSLDSVEAQYEKLLIVERVPSDEARRKLGLRRDVTTPRLSLVTQEQFADLSVTVKALQAKFTSMGLPGFPENMELMQELRKGASLTDAMAALQLSARLEATEKTLERMLSLVTELAKTIPGADLTAVDKTINTEVLYGGKTEHSKSSTMHSKKSPTKKVAVTQREFTTEISSSEASIEITLPEPLPQSEQPIHETSLEKVKEKTDCITFDELDSAMQELYDDILNTVNGITTRSSVNADKALKIATRLVSQLTERVFDTSLNLGTRMDDLEVSVAEYAEKINILDTGLSSQMTNYQEQLTQMQHDLESGLENMAEVLATAGGDTTAVAELNGQFTSLQLDFDNMALRQKDLKDLLDTLSLDLEALWKQIELLRDTKSDREEVADALRDKAGIEALNGLVSLQQFDAVRGDFEKRIVSAYDKFNNQEMVWQKAIDELLRELNEKADYIQVVSLRDEITKYLEILNGRIRAMLEIVGEPNAAAVTKKIFRDTTCLSCASPANMNFEEPGVVAALPALRGSRPPVYGAEASKYMEGEGDQVLCFPGQPIPHPQDSRAHVCQRYCGGSHTVLNNIVSRVPAAMIVHPVMREVKTGLGIDGRPYRMDETRFVKPCRTCNVPKPSTPQPSEIEQAPEPCDIASDLTLSDYNPIGDLLTSQHDASATPPPHFDED